MARRIRRVLVANRGEIAVRIVRACRELGLETVVAVSDADRETLAARTADEAVCIGPGPAGQSYLRPEAMLTVAAGKKVDALHPGYGFLSERAEFAQQCEDHGITFIGPRPEVLRLFGDKVAAKAAARAAGVPLAEASGILGGVDEAAEVAATLGYPVALKAVKGGGGKGMRAVFGEAELRAAFATASAEAAAAFGDGSLYLERFLARARHVEVQIAGDGGGRAVHFGDRDCSIQRKHQKLIEEAPAPELPDELQAELRAAALRLSEHVGYDGVGTVEFIVDPASGAIAFLEVNARLQVEHGVTEEVTGVDLVKLQVGLAESGRALPGESAVTRGHAIECRLNAEDPAADFRPCPGRITGWRPPEDDAVRVDTHCFAGYSVPHHYDSLLAKLICRGETRDSTVNLMLTALDSFGIEGVSTTRELLHSVVGSDTFRSVAHWTTWLEESLPMVAPSAAQRRTHDDDRL